jgi:O-antigen ligase
MSTISSAALAKPVLVDSQPNQPNLLLSVATFLWMLELFILYSRIFDFTLSGLRIPAVVFVMLLLTFLASGQGFAGLFSTVGKIVLSLVGWITITLAFSIWRSGSVGAYQAFLTSLAFFAVASGLSSSLRSVRLTMYALAVSGLGAALESFIWGGSYFGRQILYRGNYHDPNEYALILLMCVPFWWLMSASAKSPFGKLLPLACTIPIFYIFMRTGSRGAIIGLGAMLLIIFAKASFSRKILIASATVVTVISGLAMMPDYIRARYLTYFDVKSSGVDIPQGAAGKNEIERLKSDVDSADARKLLLLKSIDLTFRYPLFGVGPGNFPVAVFEDAKRNGEGYAWLVTHNTYTQISSETGLPGFFIFILMVFLAFRNLVLVLKLTKPEGTAPEREIYNAAKYLLLSLTAVFTTVFFLSFGYYPLLYILAGLTVGLQRVARMHEEKWKAAAISVEQPSVAESFKPAVPGFRLPVGQFSNGRLVAGEKEEQEERPRPARFNRYR